MSRKAESTGGEDFFPSLAKAGEAAIKRTRPEILGARAQVMLDEKKVYETLADELLKESIAQRVLADRHGITLPADAGANAIEIIKGKYFSKMDQYQLVDSFRNITNRIHEKRRKDPKYVDSQQYRMDYYWLQALLQRMQDTRYIDDPQGTAEQRIMADIEAIGLDPKPFADGLESYRARKKGDGSSVEKSSGDLIDLPAIISDGTKKDAFKAVLSKIGLTADMLNGMLGPMDIRNLQVGVDRELSSFDLNPVGISGDALKAFIAELPRAGSSVINNLKSIIS